MGLKKLKKLVEERLSKLNTVDFDNRLFEVEQKFSVEDFDKFEKLFQNIGDYEIIGEEYQIDTYFKHPTRNLKKSDEVFRLRQVGGNLFITYKGPKISKNTKVRNELEVKIDTTFELFANLLCILDFRIGKQVKKSRRKCNLRYEDCMFEIAYDKVENVGNFIEIETIVQKDSIKDAEGKLLSLSKLVGLVNPIRKSYVSMV